MLKNLDSSSVKVPHACFRFTIVSTSSHTRGLSRCKRRLLHCYMGRGGIRRTRSSTSGCSRLPQDQSHNSEEAVWIDLRRIWFRACSVKIQNGRDKGFISSVSLQRTPMLTMSRRDKCVIRQKLRCTAACVQPIDHLLETNQKLIKKLYYNDWMAACMNQWSGGSWSVSLTSQNLIWKGLQNLTKYGDDVVESSWQNNAKRIRKVFLCLIMSNLIRHQLMIKCQSIPVIACSLRIMVF